MASIVGIKNRTYGKKFSVEGIAETVATATLIPGWTGRGSLYHNLLYNSLSGDCLHIQEKFTLD